MMSRGAPHPVPHPGSGGRLVAADDRDLPLTRTRLRVDACAGLARVVVEQCFANPFDEALTVTYALALPHAGAVAGFAFRVGERRVIGEVDRVESARERFEEALLQGRTAGLLEQERASVFTQQIGNVPPRGEVTAEITVDQPLDWLADGAWEWRFPTVVAAHLRCAAHRPGRARGRRRRPRALAGALRARRRRRGRGRDVAVAPRRDRSRERVPSRGPRRP